MMVSFGCPCVCICTCPCSVYVKQQVDARNNSIRKSLKETGVEGVTLVTLTMDRGRPTRWFDQHGTPHRGWPIGYNLVFNTKAQLAWAPQQVAAALVQGAMVAPATVGNTAAFKLLPILREAARGQREVLQLPSGESQDINDHHNDKRLLL